MQRNKVNHGKRLRFKTQRYNIILLLLWTVSAYSLNRDIPVFAESVNWLNWYILIYSAAFLIVSLLKEKKNLVLDKSLVFILSTASIFHFYQTLMTLKLYPLMVASFWFFGVSFHSLVPLVSLILCLKILKQYYDVSSQFWNVIIGSYILIFALLFSFIWHWNTIIDLSEKDFVSIETPYKGKDIPAWCELGQKMNDNWISKRILGGSDVFVTSKSIFDWNFFRSNQKHDPLVLAANLISGDLNFTFREKKKLTKTIFNKRHESEWKLWRDADLITKSIDTKVKLIPKERIAYTEKVFEVKNVSSWERSQQEALYTFYVPQGSVVSSASLWINGIEEKSYLTTKTKADSAYKTIVGRDRRDPLLVHWQEGNRVTARIFPVTPKEMRKFKIGVTSPLVYEEGELKYKNIDFKGPDMIAAKETIELIINDEDDSTNLDSPLLFDFIKDKHHYDGIYLSNWSLSIDAPKLEPATFNFDNRSYSVLEANQEQKNVNEYRKIYLDLNSSWNKREAKSILQKYSYKQIYVFDGYHMVKLTASNFKKYWKQLRKLNFSTFPIYKVADPTNSLLITKNDHITPVIDDFKKSPFGNHLDAFMEHSAGKLTVVDIGDEPSQLIGSLVELKSLVLARTSFANIIDNGVITIPVESENSIAIAPSDTRIVEMQTTGPVSTASDHLMRLFAYNKLLQNVGKEFSKRKSIEEEHIDLAEKAHILSPISSMIVLESQADYDRFDIKRNKNSLGNATLNSNGAVPEPAEWLLIILVLITLLLFQFKSKL